MSQDNHLSREKARLDLLESIGEASRLSQVATARFDDRVAAFLGVNHTDSGCLEIIARGGKVSAGMLANETGLTTGAVTAIVDRLEASGYVQRVRDPVDRRKVWVECTSHATEVIETIFGVYDLIGPIMIDHFTTEQLHGILAFLRIGTRINETLAEGLAENTKPGAAHDDRLAQAKLFRRAIDAMGERLSASLEELAPKGR